MATAPRPDRPQPLIADRLLGMKPFYDRAGADAFGKVEWSRLKQNVRSAQKFVLTTEAYERIVEAMNASPEQLIYNAKFALPPHDLTWFELNGEDTFFGRQYDANTAYLIANGTLYTFWAHNEEERVLIAPWTTELHRPSTREDQIKLMTDFAMGGHNADRAYWGHLYDKVPEKLQSRMRQQHTTRMLPAGVGVTEWSKVKDTMDFSVRIILATLLALNQPKSVLNITAKEAQRRMTAKGSKRYFAHNVVSIQLGKKTNIRFNYRVPGGTHAGPRWHEVMGHWMHFPTEQGKNCTHGYGQDPDWWEEFHKEEDDGRLRYRCRQCGSKRVWREYPEGRGDGARGMSLHHHVVQG